MSERARELLVRGIGAARAKDKQEARFYLEWVLREGSNQEQKVEAWFWLSQVADTSEQKRGYLEDILALEPHNQRALHALADLDGRMDARQNAAASAPSVAISADMPPAALLQQGKAAIKAQQLAEARAYLTGLLQHAESTREQKIQGWFWLSETCDTLIEKRRCLNGVLTLDPDNAVARRALGRLEDQTEALLSEPASQPNAALPVVPESASEGMNLAARTQAVMSRTFPCPQCGDTLAFTPGKNAFLCGYCGYQRALLDALRPDADIEEQAFLAPFLRLQEQARPVAMPGVACQSCNAVFLQGAVVCPYCENDQLAVLPPRELFAPQGLIPFTVTQAQAKQSLTNWLQREKVRVKADTLTLRALYLPVWQFTIGGAIIWRYTSKRLQEGVVSTVAAGMLSPTAALFEAGKALASSDSESGSEPIEHDDLLVPATHRLAQELLAGLPELPLAEAVPVSASLLRAGAVEFYQIEPKHAALAARHQALERNRTRLSARIRGVGGIDVQQITFSTAEMAAAAYRLLLMPFWITTYETHGISYIIAVDGKSGVARGQKPAGGFKKLLGGLLGGG